MPQTSSPTVGSLKQGSASSGGSGRPTGNCSSPSAAAAADAATFSVLDLRLLAFFRAAAAAVRVGTARAWGSAAA
eukprot:1272103-Heterocapsa_arctica.AAC.1